jgi:hypothetical protein
MGSGIYKTKRRSAGSKLKKENIQSPLQRSRTQGNPYIKQYDSLLEKEEALWLWGQAQIGAVQDVEEQVTVQIIYNGKKVTEFTIDFKYKKAGVQCWKECKGHFHEKDRLRFKLFLASLPEEDLCFLQEKRSKQFRVVKLGPTGKILKNVEGKWKEWSYK